MTRPIPASCHIRKRHLTDAVKQIAVVDDPVADDMDHLSFLLHPPLHTYHCGGHNGAPLRFESIGSQDAVGNARLVFNSDEQHAFGAARLLPDKDHASNFDTAAIAEGGQIGAANDSASG